MNSTGGSSWGWKKRSKEQLMAIQPPYPGTRRIAEPDRRGRPPHVGDRGLRGRGRATSRCTSGGRCDPRRIFPTVETIELPDALPELAGGAFLVSGSGRRLREIIHDPAANLGFVRVDAGGQTGTPLHLAAAAVRPADQRVQLAPGGPPRPGAADRHELPRGDPRAAAAPGLPEPRPALSGRSVPQPPPARAGSRRRSSTCRRGWGSSRSVCPARPS